MGVAGILICFSEELGHALYSNDEAALYIRLLAPLVPVMYLDSTTDALLKGLGEQLYSMNVNIIDALLSVIAVYFTVPTFGINGYIVVIIVMELINFSLSATRMLNVSGMKVQIFSWVIKPIICIVAATLISRALITLLPVFTVEWIALVCHIALSITIYIVALLAFRVFGKEDREWIFGVIAKKNSSETNDRMSLKT